jgi:hypothetical protein
MEAAFIIFALNYVFGCNDNNEKCKESIYKVFFAKTAVQIQVCLYIFL